MPGSKKGRTFSPEARQRMAEAARNRKRSPEERQRLSDQMKAKHADPEWEAKRVAALQEALTGTTCPRGCPCEKHSEETSQRISEARSGTTQSGETRKKIGKGSRAAWAAKTPAEMDAIRAQRSEAARASWALEKAEGRVRQIGGYLNSNHELALIPYMGALGYQHNTDIWIGRKVPDFIDFDGSRGAFPRGRIIEYFGRHWHPEPLEEQWVVNYYRKRGYSCQVLWETDLFSWLQAHAHLVTAEEHEHAWKVAHVNNGYRKPSEAV